MILKLYFKFLIFWNLKILEKIVLFITRKVKFLINIIFLEMKNYEKNFYIVLDGILDFNLSHNGFD